LIAALLVVTAIAMAWKNGIEGEWHHEVGEVYLDIATGQDQWERAITHYICASYSGEAYLISAIWGRGIWSRSLPSERGYLKLG
jgi:hypothetical protein